MTVPRVTTPVTVIIMKPPTFAKHGSNDEGDSAGNFAVETGKTKLKRFKFEFLMKIRTVKLHKGVSFT